ncbi:DNA-binding transcriptional regulator, LysR family [Arthrobacter sp. ok909]|nr:DNA-binding transcriptional regulator, LysR family [Arthrobacter sp. ok909]
MGPMRMLPTALLYFHDVARTGSITEAAIAQHVSASAISRQISNLERTIGVTLFARHPRGMTLTEAGRLLLAHARRSEAEGEALIRELQDFDKRQKRIINIVSSEGLARCRVPRAIARFTVDYHDVDFHLDVVSSAEATRMVVDGQADIAAVYALGLQRDVTVEFSAAAPAFAVVATGHPLADRSSVSLDELCAYPLTLPAKGLSQRELFDIAVQMEQISPRIALSADQVSPALEFARAGAGAALMSRLVAHPEGEDGLAFVAIDHPVFHQRQAQIQTMAGRRRPAVQTAFIEVLAEVLAEG